MLAGLAGLRATRRWGDAEARGQAVRIPLGSPQSRFENSEGDAKTSISSCWASASAPSRIVCREIVARDPRWRAMIDNVKTVATQAFQVWMREDMATLGWTRPAGHAVGLRQAVRHLGRHDACHPRRGLARAADGRSPTSATFSPMPTPDRDPTIPTMKRRDARRCGATLSIFSSSRSIICGRSAVARFRRLRREPADGPTRRRIERPVNRSRPCAVRLAILDGERQPDGPLCADAARHAAPPHLAARQHLRQSDHCRRLDGLRLQRRVRGGRGHVRPARRARDLAVAAARGSSATTIRDRCGASA